MRLVIIESPCKAITPWMWGRNKRYAVACIRDCLNRGETPYASHVILAFSGALDDRHGIEREEGINAGLAWIDAVEKVVVYQDFGVSPGMLRGIENAKKHGVPVEFRKIGTKSIHLALSPMCA